ncbi:RnfABCDGE type electron transport complex subunit G [Metapseudomonas otitidis]|uniref:RnfABCDGE type electron transport complex subunit G n=2 Tax=Metapseudomonas otitidis TaxID=319939 RepID=UPI0013F65CA1|nr:RnfABCDGE type electron transport complex subunit G [Pseudomonas otitidis]
MSGRSLACLLAAAALAAGLLTALHGVLAPRQEAAAKASAERALLDLLPAGSYDNRPLQDSVPLSGAADLGSPSPATAWHARQGGRLVAVLLPVRARGYEGPIDLLLAIAPDGRLLHSKVLAHRETPGIGDRIEASRSPWLGNLAGRRLAEQPGEWRVRADGGDVDQIAGATITSRAVVAGIQAGLRYFDAHRDALLGATP